MSRVEIALGRDGTYYVYGYTLSCYQISFMIAIMLVVKWECIIRLGKIDSQFIALVGNGYYSEVVGRMPNG